MTQTDQPQPKPGRIIARVFTDPGCPFGYSANPVFRTLEWRYRDQIEWQLVMVGLSEPGDDRRFSEEKMARTQGELRDLHGMPFEVEPKIRFATTARACQAIIAARLIHPGFEWRVLRALQLLQFNTPLLLDDDDHLLTALEVVSGLDALQVVLAIDTPMVQNAYRADRDATRSATGGPAHMQGRTASTPYGNRYTAPTMYLSLGEHACEVGGLQPVEAYDLAIANLDPRLNRIDPASDPLDALRLYPGGLATQEVAALTATGMERPDRGAAESELIGLQAKGLVRKIPLGNDSIWLAG